MKTNNQAGDESDPSYKMPAWLVTKASTAPQVSEALTHESAREMYDRSFATGISALRSYATEHGDVQVPLGFVQDGVLLHSWANNSRSAYRKGVMTEARVAELEAVPGWAWDRWEYRFRRGLSLLTAYLEREGHIEVPTGHSEAGVSLRAWMNRVKDGHRLGTLTPEHAAAVEALDGWSWNIRGRQFDTGMAALRAFADREGHVSIPRGYREDGFGLYAWCNRNRLLNSREQLPPDRVASLGGVPGWTWGRGAVS
jgi:hypothetical protein